MCKTGKKARNYIILYLAANCSTEAEKIEYAKMS